ncbi:MAG: Gfo/Idh/MocA family oxidoreductase [Bacteroidales bacterium]
MNKNFAIIGIAGYIAPRHVKAIKDTGNRLIAALDPFDSVGFIDSFFPEADYFSEYERFDRHIDKLKRQGITTDYVSICSPNYLHDSHIRFALKSGADAICEKPLVLNPWNVDALCQIEKETGKKVNTILQLRLHPSIIKLKKQIEQNPNKVYDIDLTYITSRGNWYYFSWKGDIQKSGGIATNIGIHFFDMLIWLFGDVLEQKVFLSKPNKASGFIVLKNARVRWFLSLDLNDIPANLKEQGKRTFRSITLDGNEIEFSDGFTDLHTESYKNIIAGNGFGLAQARPSIELAYNIRNAKISELLNDFHPYCLNNIQ